MLFYSNAVLLFFNRKNGLSLRSSRFQINFRLSNG